MNDRIMVASMVAQGLCVGCAGVLDGEFTAYAKGHCNSEIAKRAIALADAIIVASCEPVCGKDDKTYMLACEYRDEMMVQMRRADVAEAALASALRAVREAGEKT